MSEAAMVGPHRSLMLHLERYREALGAQAPAACEAILAELIREVRVQFAAEEDAMGSAGSDLEEAHREAHRSFLLAFDSRHAVAQVEQGSHQYRQLLYRWLARWFVAHQGLHELDPEPAV